MPIALTWTAFSLVISSPPMRRKLSFGLVSKGAGSVKVLWSVITRKWYPWRLYHAMTSIGGESPSELIVWLWRFPLNHLSGESWAVAAWVANTSDRRTRTNPLRILIMKCLSQFTERLILWSPDFFLSRHCPFV